MNGRALKFAGYWRNSLADAESSKGGWRQKDLDKLVVLPAETLSSGLINKRELDKLFLGEAEDVHTIEVTLRPWAYQAVLEHGKAHDKDCPELVTPVVTQALLNRHGQLFPSSKTVIPRDILEPLAKGSFAIGRVDEQDLFLTTNKYSGITPIEDGQALEASDYDEQWTAYLSYCKRFLNAVGDGWLDSKGCYALTAFWYLFKERQVGGASVHIVPLYDHIRRTNPNSALFDRYALLEVLPAEPCLMPNAGFAARLGHSNDNYPLASAQRDALTHLLASRDGDILGVNGPPGTGKTTLLLSVVASFWAKAALEGSEPPIIVASSSNNQAVTNIIDAFGKDFSTGEGVCAGRWLPDIKSFGAYFPSVSKTKELGSTYQTRSFFESLESSKYLEKAKKEYLAKAALAFPNEDPLTLRAAVDRLQAEIRRNADALSRLELAWQALISTQETVRKELGNDPKTVIERHSRTALKMAEDLEKRQLIVQGFEVFLANESIFFGLFSWLPTVARKRVRLARLSIKTGGLQLTEQEQSQLDSARTIDEIEASLWQQLNRGKQVLKDQQALTVRAELLLAQVSACLAEWAAAQSVLKLEDERPKHEMHLSDCDELADTQIRFKIFLLATHYWEGRWLMEVGESLDDISKSREKNGRKALQKRWCRWMKLTPCIVSTFYMLPKEMKGSRYDGAGHVDDYMYNLIDLLIVDEAGQVLPEVAGASFALAKQALVIGDTLQIEPIWSVPASVDIGNLTSAGLLPAQGLEDTYDAIGAQGKSAASGSVMRIAQNASRFHYDKELERGMYLYEHRRCYDSIIDYCNALCYQGKLQPKRGAKPEGGLLPALGYLHIDGICQQANGGSRHNQLEAEVIAEWILANRAELQTRYAGLDISEIVGVVTPFSAQTRAIVEACGRHGLLVGKGKGEITVGTVHSLQGAERPVVIFSAVYSKHVDGGFIDSRSSMLNVAVSRAKDSFLVFGDMDVFASVARTKPRGLLADVLMQDPASELSFKSQPRTDLQTVQTGVSHLHGYAEHDAFLLKALSQAADEVHIVTPWINLDRIKTIGAWDSMTDAVKRGVRVSVYTDKELNVDRTRERAAGKSNELEEVIETLKGQGIEAHLVRKVHSKIVMADAGLLCIGSFNWFSASRSGEYVRHETSMVYRGPDVAKEIEVNKGSLANRIC